jgi:hypothetical protein
VSGQDKSFTITAFPPPGSSIVQVTPASDYLEVLAGVPYSYSLITCSIAFFGTTAAQVNAKVSSFDGGSCDSPPSSVIGSPFDGVTKPTQLTQLMTRWSTTKFDFAGNFTVCVNVSSAATLLPIKIVSRGVTSNTLKMFCLYSVDTSCTVEVPGNSMSGQADARIALVSVSAGTCGGSLLSTPFNQATSGALLSKLTREVHDLGYLTDSSPLSTYKACYCPSYQASGGSGGAVCTDLPANYVQTIGSLILMKVTPMDALSGSNSVVYPRLKFDLHVLCGNGGCATDSSPRIKLVDSNVLNRKPYYDSLGGCRFALETQSFLSPQNCESASSTNCALTRSNQGDSTEIIFSGMQLANELTNNVMVQKSFDVCFCDSGCDSRNNWFFAGSFSVLPLKVDFTFNSSPVSRLAVNVPGSIKIYGSGDGAFRTTGTQSREMKLLSDSDGSVNSEACYSRPQSESFVANHDCYSLTNCAIPILSSRSQQVYGNDLIEIKQAGWAAVCYCNAQCGTSAKNWMLVGRILVAGPKGDQYWTFTEGSSFSLSIDGYAITSNDTMRIIAYGEDCTSSPSLSPDVSGTVAFGGPLAGLSDGYQLILGGNGTVVDFGSPHGLSEGDRVTIAGVSTGSSDIDSMINTDHRVSILSAQTVRLNLQFRPGQFPSNIDFTYSSWRRTSRIDFPAIFSIGTTGIYTVCWVGDSSASSAGALQIIEI